MCGLLDLLHGISINQVQQQATRCMVSTVVKDGTFAGGCEITDAQFLIRLWQSIEWIAKEACIND